MNTSKQKGFGLIEIIIATTIGIMVFLGVSECLNSFLKAAIKNINTTEALFFAKSSLEQARAVRDEDWVNISSLNPGDFYCFNPSGTAPEKWIAQTGTKNEEGYTMWITVSEVQRDGNDDIVSSGGVNDSNTLKITSNVSWLTTNGTEQISLFEYLTNFR